MIPSVDSLRQAVSSHQAGDFLAAIRSCLHVLAQAPDNVDALRLLGGIAIDAAQDSLALDCLERALAIGPPDAGVLYNLSLLRWRGGDLDVAIDLLEQALTMDASDARVRMQLCQALKCRLGETHSVAPARSGVQDLARWLQLDPGNPQAVAYWQAMKSQTFGVYQALCAIADVSQVSTTTQCRLDALITKLDRAIQPLLQDSQNLAKVI